MREEEVGERTKVEKNEFEEKVWEGGGHKSGRKKIGQIPRKTAKIGRIFFGRANRPPLTPR